MKITSLTHLGHGRAEDGSFVPGALPGEDVEIGDDGALRVLAPSPDRVRPVCRHFKTCGGCSVQHLRDDAVAEWKSGIVARALSAQGLPSDIAGIHTSPPSSRRRAKLTGRRTKKGAMVGFHGRASDTLVEVPECQVLRPAIIAALPLLEDLTTLLCSRKDRVQFTVTDTTAGLDVLIDHDGALTDALRLTLPQMAQAHGLARISYGDEPLAQITAPAQSFGALRVTPPPGAFLQATAEGEAVLVAQVLRITQGAKRVADLFSGCGTFSGPLAVDAEVLAVENAPDMLEALDQGWRVAKGLKAITTLTRDLFRRPLLPDELAKFDAVVIDPPRAGAEAQVAEVAQSGVKRVAMVSCNPVTFARDAATLVGAGFEMSAPMVVDQFRWSTHIEMVAGFTKS